jgi:hypothetical protein
MDELLFPWKPNGTALLTLLPFDGCHLDYLCSLGRDVTSLSDISSLDEWRASGSPENTFDAMRRKRMAQCQVSMRPYAVTHEFDMMVETQSEKEDWPSLHSVVEANSKVFSSRCSSEFEPNIEAIAVDSIAKIREFQALHPNDFILLKDPFGVSGKGQYLIRDQKSLERIERFLTDQQRKGLQIELVSELFTPFRNEFSSYFELKPDGEAEFLGIRQTLSRGARYIGYFPPEESRKQIVKATPYLGTLEKYLHQLHNLGYFGPVCFDSAVIERGGLRCVVEINARQSLGSIALELSQFLRGFGTDAGVYSVDLTLVGPLSISAVFDSLRRAGLLWERGHEDGIIPLTTGSFRHLDSAAKRTRWYFGIVGTDQFQREETLCSIRSWWTEQPSFRSAQWV